MGLECSSQTSLLSPVAGHEGFDLIQLSKASSPIFERQIDHFPHLWRFSTAATVYSDTVLAIMDQFNWTRVGIVYSVVSSLYSELAKDIEQRIKQSGNKSVAFSLGIRGTKAYCLDAVISNIKSKETGVLVTLLSYRQTLALMKQAYNHGLIYPHYTWIQVARHPLLLSSNVFQFRGNILLYAYKCYRKPYIVSNKTFTEYEKEFRAQWQKIPLLNNSSPKFIQTSNYDQVWAIALHGFE